MVIIWLEWGLQSYEITLREILKNTRLYALSPPHTKEESIPRI